MAAAGDGVTRRQWQALNTLHQRPSTQAELAEALQPFLVDDPGADRRVIDELVARGWVRPGEGDRLELTLAGAGAHAGLLERIQATRQLLVRERGSAGAERRRTSGELLQEAEIVLVEETNVVDLMTEQQLAFHTHAPGDTGHLLGIVAAVA